MQYSEAFFHMALNALTQSNDCVKICAPLMFEEFDATLEPSFANGNVQDRIEELVNYAFYGAEPPSWYKNGVSRAMNRIGGTDPFAEKVEE